MIEREGGQIQALSFLVVRETVADSKAKQMLVRCVYWLG